MSTLIVALPVPPRLSSQGAAGATLAPSEYDYVVSADGGPRLMAGRAAPALLPKTQSVVAVVPPHGIGWHRVTLPKAPPAKLRAALASVMEDVLLEDDAELHLALAPHAKSGDSTWVAALSKPWLKAQLDALEADGLTVDRVVPAWPPDDAPAGHFFRAEPLPDGTDPGPQLAWRDSAGPLCLPAASEAARTLLARVGGEVPVRWTAEPECAADAVRLAGGNVAALSVGEFQLAAARSDWNLRQFDLTPQRRGSRAAKELLQHLWSSPAWRPARYGVAVLLLLNLVGANVWAWQQRQALTRQKAAMTALLQTTFPQVRAIVDAPAQMQKELDLLRASAGKPGENDLEPMMYAAEAAWPPGRAPADGLKYEPGRLMITSAGWSPQEVEAFRGRLRPLGYDAESVPGRLTLTRAKQAELAMDVPAAPPRPGAAPTNPPATPPAGPAAAAPNAPRPVPELASPPPPQMGNRPLPGARPVPGLPQGSAPMPRPAGAEQPHRMPTQSPTGVNNAAEM
ncbi:type II secretion system protein GspL [Ideonella sp.]|uniref:type II secretion system protein GspL n=1 Tax=Ideonella sp. TaxID=1929293 RepID=UPI002B4855CD|nr:type II secretion system protein GspL [Ideonella sp.]HJV70663.1 type II secretion system protein GspL [Ideonella sp.]